MYFGSEADVSKARVNIWPSRAGTKLKAERMVPVRRSTADAGTAAGVGRQTDLGCAFLSQVLPYGNANWEKLSIFLSFLVNKLPAPVEDDLSKGVLDAVDMDSYRME